MTRYAFLELTSCGDCLSELYMNPEINKLLEEGEIVYWPAYGIVGDPEEIGEVDVTFIAGTVRTRRDLEELEKFRRISRIVVAYGTCSIYGGLNGLTALLEPRAIADGEYVKLLMPTVKPVTDYIEPDILVPGCPPTREVMARLAKTLKKYISGGKPEKKIFLIPGEVLCKHCPRRPSNPEKAEMPGIRDPNEVVDDGRCFIEQGILCLGPVTANGCNHLCIRFNHPCMGCMGPARGVVDQGLNMIGSIGSILLKSREVKLLFPGLAKELDKLRDPMGYFYRYTLPKAMLTKLALRRRGVE